MRVSLSDGRCAYDSGNKGLLIAAKPHSDRMALGFIAGVTAALAAVLAVAVIICRRRR